MKQSKFFSKIERIIHGLSIITNYAAITVLFLMLLLVGADVIARYVFNRSITGAMEINELMMVTLVFMGLGYCTLERGHIQVDLLVTRFSEHTRVILDSITSFLSAVIFGLIVWQMGMQGLRWLFSTSGRLTLLLEIPEAPFVLIATLGSLMACLEMLIHSFQSLGKVIKS